MTPAEFRKVRRMLDLTQQQLADMLGVTSQTIYLWERKGPPLVAQAAIWAIERGRKNE